MKTITKLTMLISATILITGCSNPVQAIKPMEQKITTWQELDKNQDKELLNKTLQDLKQVSSNAAKAGVVINNGCAIMQKEDKKSPNVIETTLYKTCYDIREQTITSKTTMECSAKRFNYLTNKTEVTELSDCKHKNASYYAAFIDEISKRVTSQFQGNVTAMLEEPHKKAQKIEALYLAINEIGNKNYRELQGQTIEVPVLDSFGKTNITTQCTVSLKYANAIKNNKYEPLKLFQEHYAGVTFNLSNENKLSAITKSTNSTSGMSLVDAGVNSGFINGTVNTLVKKGIIPQTFNIESSSSTSGYSIKTTESAFNVFMNIDGYLFPEVASERDSTNRMFLIHAFLISTGKYNPRIDGCKIYISATPDIDLAVLIGNRDPKALKLYSVLREKNATATTNYLLNNDEVYTVFSKMKEVVKGL